MRRWIKALTLLSLSMGVLVGTVGCPPIALDGHGQGQGPQVSVYFTYPGTTRLEDDNPERTVFVPLLSQLGEGDRLDIAIYIFTDDQIGDAVLTAWQNGAEVRIFTEEAEACDRYSEIPRLAAAGIPIRTDGHSGLMHHKFLVINEHTVVTGSYNWSDSADRKNWENVVVIEGPEVARDYAANFELMWSQAAPFTGCP